MPGLGTIVNVLAIIAGGILGRLCGKALSERTQGALLNACGIMCFFMGTGGALAKMLAIDNGTLSTNGIMMMIASLLIGALIGEWIDLEGKIEKFGVYLKAKTHNERDTSFVNAFVTTSLTVCIGAMAVIGSIEDGIYANHSILYTKAVLDFIIVMAMAASMGPGAIFSCISVGVLQGLVTVLAVLLKPLMTDAAMSNLSYVGNILIACVGINLLWPRKINVANLLPSLIIAVIWAFLPL